MKYTGPGTYLEAVFDVDEKLSFQEIIEAAEITSQITEEQKEQAELKGGVK